MRYGLPYMGSKSRICSWLMDHLPPAENFVDLFAGGCAVTHAALLSGRYRHVHANDIQRDVLNLFKKCITTGLSDDDWAPLPRDEFFLRAPSDALVRLVWSFGSKGDTYLYGRDVEDVKLAAHAMLVGRTVQDRLKAYHHFIQFLPDFFKKDDLPSLERLQALQALLRMSHLSLSLSLLSFIR